MASYFSWIFITLLRKNGYAFEMGVLVIIYFMNDMEIDPSRNFNFVIVNQNCVKS